MTTSDMTRLTPEQALRQEALRAQVRQKLGGADPVSALEELFEEWRREPIDAAELEGYPAEITPLSLREVDLG